MASAQRGKLRAFAVRYDMVNDLLSFVPYSLISSRPAGTDRPTRDEKGTE